jgi:hypothetical protein
MSPPKLRELSELQGVAALKAVILIVTAVTSSNPKIKLIHNILRKVTLLPNLALNSFRGNIWVQQTPISYKINGNLWRSWRLETFLLTQQENLACNLPLIPALKSIQL